MKQKVTCPETGCLEEIVISHDPIDGHIAGVERCSRWSDDHVDCAQTCAHRLNQRLPNIIRRERTTGRQPVIEELHGQPRSDDDEN